MIRVEDHTDHRVITLDRPDKANALTESMLQDLCEAVTHNPHQALILTGTGRVFSAGADLDAARAGLALSPLWERLSAAIANGPAMTVAALNGTCAGGAMGMVLACDLRVSVPGAKFFYPVMKLGFLPQPSDPGRLAALVSVSRAKMILMAGQKVEADEALAWGLLDQITADPIATALDLTADARAADAAHVSGIKGLFA